MCEWKTETLNQIAEVSEAVQSYLGKFQVRNTRRFSVSVSVPPSQSPCLLLSLSVYMCVFPPSTALLVSDFMCPREEVEKNCQYVLT